VTQGYKREANSVLSRLTHAPVFSIDLSLFAKARIHDTHTHTHTCTGTVGAPQAWNEGDVDAYTEHCADFNAVCEMDSLRVALLVRCKRGMM
jgi:hypothetical protein